MTSLAVSVSVDSRGMCAIYIITDSRITWDSAVSRWDAGQKAFASEVTPDIFAFCGDFFFPSSILRQMVSQINAGIVFGENDSADMRHATVLKMLSAAMHQQQNAPMLKYSIYHASRDGSGQHSVFRLWRSDYYVNIRKWSDIELPLTDTISYIARMDGTGRNAIQTHVDLGSVSA